MSHSATLLITPNAESVGAYTAFSTPGAAAISLDDYQQPPRLFPSTWASSEHIVGLGDQERFALTQIETLTYFKTLSIFEEYLIFPDWQLRQYQNSILGGVRSIFSTTATSRAKSKKFVEKIAKSIQQTNRGDATDKWTREIIKNKHRHARALFFFHHAMSVVQHYRHHFATDPSIREEIVDEARRCHDNRLTLGELTEAYLRAELRDGTNVDFERVANDLETMLQFFRRYLEKKANDDATLFCQVTGIERDNVAHRKIRRYLRESYLERFIDSGLLIPRVQKAISMVCQSK